MKTGIILFSILLQISSYNTQDPDFIQKQKSFVKELFESGSYFDCIAEARRLQTYSNYEDVEYLIYTNYYMAGQYKSVINGYRFKKSEDEESLPARLLVSQSYLALGCYGESYHILGPPVYDSPDEKSRFLFFLRRIEPLVLAGDYDSVENEIQSAQDVIGGYNRFNELEGYLESFKNEEGISPLTGGIMSAVIPGLGQAWTGRFLDGLLSFVSVAFPAAGGFYLDKKDYSGAAYTLFFFTGLFYAGNIYGGYNSAAIELENSRKENHVLIEEQFGKYDPVIYIRFGSIFN